MDIKSLKKKPKEDSMTAARVKNSVLTVLRDNNINISKAIRDHLGQLASALSPKRKKAS